MRPRNYLPPFRLSLLATAVAILIFLAPRMAGAASATTYFVAPGGSDASACSANSSAAPFATIQKALGCAVAGDVVQLAPSGVKPYPGIGPVADSVTIQAQPGAGARTVTVDAGKGELSVAPGAEVAVSGLSLSCIANDCFAAPTVTNEGALTLSADAVEGNFGGYSGIVNTTPAGSSTPASLTVVDSTVSGNAGRFGGGIQSSAGSGATGAVTLSIANSTIANNAATMTGGGVAVNGATAGSSASIVNSTIAGNSTNGAAGGLYAASTVSLSNSIVATNTAHTGTAPDCQGTNGARVLDGPGGGNLIGIGGDCPLLRTGIAGDQVGVPRPGLLGLADNGGPTDTVALQSDSPALDAGDPATCAAPPLADADQRGFARHSAARGACDVGAYDTAGAGGAIDRTYFVAPGGSDALACPANSPGSPFSTIQKALGCAVDGDVVSLAPSGSHPYPGIGAVADNVAIQAQSRADARKVTVDAGKGELSVAPGADVTLAGVHLACPENDCSVPTVTDEGALTLSADELTGNQSAQSAILQTTPPGSTTATSLHVNGSTVGGNAGKLGGGVLSTAGAGASGAISLSVANSTIANNFAQTLGGGVAVLDATAGSSASIVNSTITGNSAQAGGGGIYAASAVDLANTIVAGNTTRNGTWIDCQAAGGPIADGPGGHNLIGSGSGCPQFLDGVDGDRVGAIATPIDPRLAPLAYDGGATETAPPLIGSPALASASTVLCEARPILDADQRGHTRKAPRRAACDVGAFDWAGAAPSSQASTLKAPATVAAAESKRLAVKLSATGKPTAAIGESGVLPRGVTLLDSGNGTASLSGTPATGSAGAYPITITAGNGVGPGASQALTVIVAAAKARG